MSEAERTASARCGRRRGWWRREWRRWWWWWWIARRRRGHRYIDRRRSAPARIRIANRYGKCPRRGRRARRRELARGNKLGGNRRAAEQHLRPRHKITASNRKRVRSRDESRRANLANCRRGIPQCHAAGAACIGITRNRSADTNRVGTRQTRWRGIHPCCGDCSSAGAAAGNPIHRPIYILIRRAGHGSAKGLRGASSHIRRSRQNAHGHMLRRGRTRVRGTSASRDMRDD